MTDIKFDFLSLCDPKICERISKNICFPTECSSTGHKCKKCYEPYFSIFLTYTHENLTKEMLDQLLNLTIDGHSTIIIDEFYKTTYKDTTELKKLRTDYKLNFIKTFDEFKEKYHFSCKDPIFTYPVELRIPYIDIHYTIIKIYCHEELYLKFPKFNNIESILYPDSEEL